MHQAVGVCSKGDLVRVLRERCPDRSFVEGAEARSAAVLVIDTDSHEVLEESTAAAVQLVLRDDRPMGLHHPRQIRIARTAFVADPSEYVAAASEHADLLVHASQLEHEVSSLTQIHELASMVDPEAVSERVTRTILNMLGLPRGTLLLHDAQLERYVVSFSNDPDYRETGEFLPNIPQDVLQESLTSGNMLAVSRRAGLIVISLKVEHDLVGVMRVPITAADPFDETSADAIGRYLRAVVQVLGTIYQLTRSRDLALRDDLTKAFNRRFFDSYLDEEMERSRRYGTLFSIIFLDLDDLKTVNNFYGHLTGSRTLQEVAKRILGAVRAIDKVVRFGGDEFCIILPQTDQEQSIAVASRVRKAMVSSAIRVEPDIEVAITASFGIATYPTHAITKEDLIRQADQAMYRIKSTTKNAVGVATVECPPKPAAF